MKKNNSLSVLLFTAALLSGSAHASIIYHVDRTIGEGSVTGTITTDGTLGKLSFGNYSFDSQGNAVLLESNIIAYDLLVSDGTDSEWIGASTAPWTTTYYYASSAFWATPNSLLYDFTSPGFAMFLPNGENLGYGGPVWDLDAQLETVYAGPYTINYGPNEYQAIYDSQVQNQSWSSEVIIGSVYNAIPEPGSLALLCLGLAGIGCARHLKQN